uniref:Uncharacterized protein n=1 Tax=Zooxanthella nutricula TaxID=1333877 RepID=A0A7S2K4C1_9DINO
MAQPSMMRRSTVSGTLRKSGEVALGGTSPTGAAAKGELTKFSPPPKVPKYLSVHALTVRRKLSQSTGNLHGYLAEDYHQLNWPLPKMFGKEKYGHSLIDITDPRHLVDCAQMSKKLNRLNYDQQIVDLEWRKTYKDLLDAERRLDTLFETSASKASGVARDLPLPGKGQIKAQEQLKKEIDRLMKYLLELQEQKDMYDAQQREIMSKCDDIKRTLKKENDLENLRQHMEARTRDSKSKDSPFWRTKFEIHSDPKRTGQRH